MGKTRRKSQTWAENFTVTRVFTQVAVVNVCPAQHLLCRIREKMLRLKVCGICDSKVEENGLAYESVPS